MRQNVPMSLEGLDPETRDLARDAARRAGLSLDEWVASALGEGPARANARRRTPRPEPERARGPVRARAQAPAEEPAAPRRADASGASLDAVARWLEESGRRAEAGAAAEREAARRDQERTARVVGEAVSHLSRRLDGLEGRLATDRNAVKGAEIAKTLARIEAQLDAARGVTAGTQTEALAREIEARIGTLTERLAQQQRRQEPQRGDVARFERDEEEAFRPPPARPPADRARADGARADVASAIAEIRARQDELDERPQRPVISPQERPEGRFQTHREEAGRAGASFEGGRREPPSLATELAGLQEAVGRLATRDEVATLERAIQGVALGLRGSGDVDTVAAPVAALEGEVRRLQELVLDGLHGQLARDIGRLSDKLDTLAVAGAEPALSGALSREFASLRHTLDRIAEPQRVLDLGERMGELTRHIEDLRRTSVDGDAFAQLRAAVEEIRSGLGQPRGEAQDSLSPQIAALTERLDRIGGGADLEPVTRRLDALASIVAERGPDEATVDALTRGLESMTRRLDAAILPESGLAVLTERLDRLDRSLRTTGGADLKPIESLLGALADRIDQAGRGGAEAEALDALERQVAALASRLDQATPSGGDPAIASLERAMGDLLAQVEGLRQGTVEAAEHAAKAVMATTLDKLPAGAPEIGGLRRDLADLRQRHDHAGQRTQDTLEAVHAALERVVERLGTLDAAGPAPAPRTPGFRERSAAAPAPALRPDRPARPPESRGVPAADEVLLEPGSSRPQPRSPEAEPPPGEADVAAMRANLLAAARRAVKTATAEAAAEPAPSAPAAPRRGLADRAQGAARIGARVKAAVDRRRRPILLGLAAVVLALGALRIGGTLLSGGEPKPTVIAAPEAASAVAEPKVAEPRTTQAIAPTRTPPREGQAPAISPQPPVKEVDEAALKVPTLLNPRPEAKVMPSFEPRRPEQPGFGLPGQQTGALAAPPAAGPAPAPATPAAPGGDRIANMAAFELPGGLPAGLRAAVLAGEPAAVFELATRAADGRGVARDPKLAARLFERAAAFGLVPAQYRIGNHYEKGVGVTRDLDLARGWYQRAAEKGNARAMHNLAVMLAEGGGAKPDYTAAVEWFRKAAQHGVRDSQYNLAILQARGLGTAQDLVQSYLWFAAAAGQGDDDAGKKRDEIAGRLTPADLEAAKRQAEAFRPEPPPRAANEVATPSAGWPDPAPSAAPAPKKPPARDVKV